MNDLATDTLALVCDQLGPQLSGVSLRRWPLPAPGPADLLQSGDTIVAVGTRDGLDHLVRIIAGS